MERRKLLFIIGGGLVVLIVLIVFFASILSRPGPPARAELAFWGTYDDPTYFSELIRNYRQKNPNVTITYQQIPYEDYESSLISAFAAGNGPDIFMMQSTWLPKHLDKIQPLPETIPDSKDPLMTFKTFQETFVDVAATDLTRGTTIYGLPLYMDTMALYYNKDLFNTAGIAAPPRTWEEFVVDVGILTKRDDKSNILASAAAIGTAQNINRSTDILMLLMLQSGVRMTNADNTEATFAKPVDNLTVGELALQFYTDFANQSKPDRYTWNDRQKYSIDAFTDGNAAMMFNYSHQIQTIRGKAPRLNFGIAPMPQPGKATVRVDFANYFAGTVAKQSKNPIEAWKFLVYLTAGEGTDAYLTVANRPPARRDLIDQQKNDPDFGTFATQALTARSWYRQDTDAIETIFAKLIDDINFNRASIHEAIQQAQDQVSVIMSKAKPR